MVKFITNNPTYNLHNYHYQALNYFNSNVKFENKVCLEVGGSNLPRELLFDVLKVKKWISVDIIEGTYVVREYAKHYQQETVVKLDKVSREIFDNNDYLICDGQVEKLPGFFDEQFDICISICSCEHWLNPLRAINTIYRSLKFGAKFLTYFGPIWSSSCGNHMWVNDQLRFNVEVSKSHLDLFAHLLYSPYDLYEHLLHFYSPEIVEEAVHQIYFSTRINRLFYEDYEKVMKLSKFSQYEIEPYGNMNIEANLHEQLISRHGEKNYNAYGIKMIASKNVR